MPLNPYSEKYKELTNNQLLEILKRQADFQPEAIQAAQQEMVSRKLEQWQIDEINADIEAENTKQARQKEDVEGFKNKAISGAADLAEVTFGVRRTPLTTDRFIIIVSLFFAVIYIYQLIEQGSLFWFMITNPSAKWDRSVLSLIIPLIITPIAVILFWFRKRVGWMLLTGFISYLTFNALSAYVIALNMGHNQSVFSKIFNPFSPEIWLVLFSGAMLWAICRSSVRAVYKIETNHMIRTLLVGFVVAMILWGGMLMDVLVK